MLTVRLSFKPPRTSLTSVHQGYLTSYVGDGRWPLYGLDVGSPPSRTGIGSSLGEFCALILSHAETNHGALPKPRTNEEHNDMSSLTPESGRETCMTRRPAENLDPKTFRRMLTTGGPVWYGEIRSGDLPPADIFMSSPNFSDSSATSTPLGLSKPGGLDTTNRIKGISRGTNAAHAVGGTSPILPMELMTYNGLIFDDGHWRNGERTLYGNLFNQISKHAT